MHEIAWDMIHQEGENNGLTRMRRSEIMSWADESGNRSPVAYHQAVPGKNHFVIKVWARSVLISPRIQTSQRLFKRPSHGVFIKLMVVSQRPQRNGLIEHILLRDGEHDELPSFYLEVGYFTLPVSSPWMSLFASTFPEALTP